MTELLISTLYLAAIYSLVAIGLSLTFAGLGLLNLAHGATFTGAGYAAWWFATNVTAFLPAVLIAGALTGVLLGAVVHLLIFLPLDGKKASEVRMLAGGLAIAMCATAAYSYAFGGQARSFPELFGFLPTIQINGYNVTPDRTGPVLIAALVVAGVLLVLNRSRLGLGTRILTQNRDGAALIGINRRGAGLAILAASGALVGVAAVLLSAQLFVQPTAGYVPMIMGLIVALLGGLGSVNGAMIAAVMVAVCEALTTKYLGGQYMLVTLSLFITVFLVIRPRGVAGVLEASRA